MAHGLGQLSPPLPSAPGIDPRGHVRGCLAGKVQRRFAQVDGIEGITPEHMIAVWEPQPEPLGTRSVNLPDRASGPRRRGAEKIQTRHRQAYGF